MVRQLKWILLFFPMGFWFLMDRFLGGTGNLTMLLLYSLLPLTALVQSGLNAPDGLARGVVLTLLFLFAAVLILEVLMIPYQAYEIWFELLGEQSTRGRISRLFTKLGTLILSLLISTLLLQKRFDWSMLFLPAFMAFLLFPTVPIALLCIALYLLPHLLKQKDPALPLLMALALLFGLTGIKSEPRGVQWIDTLSGNLYEDFVGRFPELPLLYQIPLYGQSLSDYVEDGGKPALTTQTLLKVEGEPGRWVYLRTDLYENFDMNGNLRSVNRTIPREELTPASDGFEGQALTITLMTDFMSVLPLSLQTGMIRSEQGDFLWETPSSNLSWSSPPLLYEEEYTLVEDRSRILTEGKENLDWLRKPPKVSQRLKALADSLQGPNEESTVKNIQEYLLKDYTYTLDTEGREDFLDYFLFESQEGYCLHFATAFVVLARLNGVPCRLAEGYIAYLPDLDVAEYSGIPGQALLTGYSAHSWPEVYLPGQGWINLEVTPPYYHRESSYSDGRDFFSARSEAEAVVAEKSQGAEKGLPLLYLLFLLPAGALTAFLLIRNRTDRMLLRLGRQGQKKGWPDPARKGWVEWARHHPESLRLLPLILRFRYGTRPLSEDELRTLRQGIRKISSRKGYRAG